MSVTTSTSEGPFSALIRDLTTYEQRRKKSALIIACMLLRAQHQEITDAWCWSCSSSPKLRWCQRQTQKIFWTSRLLFCIKLLCLLYIHHCDSILNVRWMNCSLWLLTTFLLLQHTIYFRSVEWSWYLIRYPELIQSVSIYVLRWECLGEIYRFINDYVIIVN